MVPPLLFQVDHLAGKSAPGEVNSASVRVALAETFQRLLQRTFLTLLQNDKFNLIIKNWGLNINYLMALNKPAAI